MKVCLLDRASFPSDIASTHAIQPSGVKVLERLGVLDGLLKVAPAIDHGTVRFDDVAVELHGVADILGAPMVNARRVTLDAILVGAAEQAGAEGGAGDAGAGPRRGRGRGAGRRA